MSLNLTPLTTRPLSQSRQGMMRFAKVMVSPLVHYIAHSSLVSDSLVAAIPGQEVLQQLEPVVLALFGMELHGEHVPAADGAAKGLAISAGRRHRGLVPRFGIIAVHEIEPAAVRD